MQRQISWREAESLLVLPESDRELIGLAQTGNREAFDGLVAMHQERVFNLAFRILENRDDAADVQQETFLNAWRALGKFRGQASFATWLHRITVNLCLSRKRRRDWDEISYSDDMPPDQAGPDCAERADTAIIVRKALMGLPSHHRAFIVLREVEERPFDEIAQIMGCSVQSACVRASRARKFLRERLAPQLAEEEL
jgi:RNA polymerase sigma-70 factor, ECF subfamily